MSFLEGLRERAGRSPRRIVLPGGDDPRVRAAADALAAEGLAVPIVLGGSGGIDPAQDDRLGQVAEPSGQAGRAARLTQIQKAVLACRIGNTACEEAVILQTFQIFN